MDNNASTVVFWGPIIEKVGTEKSQFNTSRILQKLGYNTVFISFLREYPDNLGFSEIIRCPKRTTKLLVKLKYIAKARILNLILQFLCAFKIITGIPPFNKPIILHTSLSATLPILAARIKGIKTVSSIQGLPSFVYVDDKFSLWRRYEAVLRKFIWRRVYSKVTVYTISSDLRDILIKEGFENVTFIPNIVETTPKSILMKRSLTKIAIVGRISYQKNLPLLQYLIENLDGFSWDIFGSAYDHVGKEFVKRIQCLSNVKYHGHVKDPFEYTNAAFLMFPSLWDEAALTPIEAAKSGLVVIYSNKCFGANDFFINGHYELDLDMNLENLKDKVIELLCSNERQYFNDIYTEDVHEQKIKDLML